MIIRNYSVTGYKNLHRCSINISGLHAITGCNAVGKTNLMDSISFMSTLMTGSEAQRDTMLSGTNLRYESWIPFTNKEQVAPEFRIEGEVQVGSKLWEFVYELKLSTPLIEPHSYYRVEERLKITSETLVAKLKGKPGPKKKLFTRSESGEASLFAEEKRGVSNLSVAENVLLMPAVKVREASNFEKKYSVMSKVLDGISKISLIALSPKLMYEFNQQYPISRSRSAELEHHNAGSISVVNLFDRLLRIESDERLRDKLNYWLLRLLRIEETTVLLNEAKNESSPDETRHTLFFDQDQKLLFPRELSSGSLILVGLLSILLDPESEDMVVFLEEPEAYLHPRAIADFITLLHSLSDQMTIVISTHNPVVLNSIDVDNVTLMTFDDQSFARTIPVSEISAATEALERGIISFGDLLQTDFELESA